MRFYPPGAVTPYGSALLLEKAHPLVIYTSPDNGIQWCIHGGLAAYPGIQEGGFLFDGVAGLHPPFSFVEHKGASQDGVTVQRTVYDPGEMELEIELTAVPDPNNPDLAAAAIRRVVRDWMDSWDPRNPGTLAWITPDMGRWTCRPRLYRSPPDRQFQAQARRLRQRYTWTIRNDDAFWKGVDSVSDYKFGYTMAVDNFNRDDVSTLGPQWSQVYTGAGAGVCETQGRFAAWTPSGTGAREVVNRLLGINEIQTVSINGAFSGGTFTLTYSGQTTAGLPYTASAGAVQTALENLSNIAVGDVTVTGVSGGPYTVVFKAALGFANVATMTASGALLTPGGTAAAVQVATTLQGTGPNTATDNQVITVRIGEPHQWPFPTNGFLDIWGRLDSAGTTGVRARIGGGSITLSRFNAGVETVLSTEILLIPPMWREDWTLICGTATTARHFKVQRGKFVRMSFKETGTGSALGASNRGSGWGMKAGTGGSAQQVPPSVDEFSVGDNGTITQSGHLTLTNFGDQDGYPRYLVYGPGTFRIANGPDSEEMVEFGPLIDNQIALLTTQPRLRGVVDLTPDQPEQVLTIFQEFIKLLIGFATNNNVPPLLEMFESLFGIRPPQGEMYSLLNGRFTKPIPPKPAGAPPVPASIAVEIVGGSADSKVVAALTPLRVWPE